VVAISELGLLSAQARAVLPGTAESVGTGESNNLLIVEAHAVEDLQDIVNCQEQYRQENNNLIEKAKDTITAGFAGKGNYSCMKAVDRVLCRAGMLHAPTCKYLAEMAAGGGVLGGGSAASTTVLAGWAGLRSREKQDQHMQPCFLCGWELSLSVWNLINVVFWWPNQSNHDGNILLLTACMWQLQGWNPRYHSI
jgi:hypothetical protein